MSTDDYLTRYFQQLGLVIARLLGYREKGKHHAVLDEIDQTLDTWFNINNEQIEKSTVDELIQRIDDGTGKSIDKIKVLAELLYQKAISYKELEKHEEKILIAEKALGLYRLIDNRSNEYFIEIQERIAELDMMVPET